MNQNLMFESYFTKMNQFNHVWINNSQFKMEIGKGLRQVSSCSIYCRPYHVEVNMKYTDTHGNKRNSFGKCEGVRWPHVCLKMKQERDT